jgi:hypothetical protein
MLDATAIDKYSGAAILAVIWIAKEAVMFIIGQKKKNGNGDTPVQAAGNQSKEYWTLEFSRIMDEKLEEFFESRDLHIQKIVRDELDRIAKTK